MKTTKQARPNRLMKCLRTYLTERPLWKLPKTPKVLDLCCGWGFYFSINPHAIGVDSCVEAVSSLKERGFDARAANVFEGLPFEAEQFEYVVSHDAFEHFTVDQLKIVISECYRVLKPKAELVIIVPNFKGYLSQANIQFGHKLFVTRDILSLLTDGMFVLVENNAFPLPRMIGKFCKHNKEHFRFIKT